MNVRTMPEHAATTLCCIFIASSTSTSWPASTVAPSSTLNDTTVPCMGARSGTVPSGPMASAASSAAASSAWAGAPSLP